MLEEERKYEVRGDFALPALGECLPPGGRVVRLPPVTLTATYFDAPDLRLARAGVSLRHRDGDREPWTVKLPAELPGVRHEISRAGSAGEPPADLVALVSAYSRGARLRPVVVIRTARQAYELRDGDDRVLAELADDTVTVLDGATAPSTFREIEVERKDGPRRLLDEIEAPLRQGGATVTGFTPKHVRALGEAASAPADLVPPADLPRRPTGGDVVSAAIRRSVGRMLSYDPLVRLRAPADGKTAVHRMRAATRRLRSDLRTFAPLVRADWSRSLRAELKWLADALGAARDAEVLRDRLRRTADADPLCPPDAPVVARLDAQLAARHERALTGLDEVLRSQRYLTLVEALVQATRDPLLTPRAGSRADRLLPRLVSRRWRRLAYGGKGVDGAGDLDPDAPDGRWHAVRLNGKKARYAVDAVVPVAGGAAKKLAKALAGVQDLLGEHQDAVVAAETWRDIARAHPDDHALALTAGRLFERERTVVRAVRADFPRVWRRATGGRRTDWLS
ncbi:CYTH and CHAD domain-containing protein [Micromonospora sp. NPDC049679]|uniref:CYTH and CHAD domain-containing protein n=1 Tax=Micromonospora sp. NPDC049679 TaxID=3155920 RepID=UPI0033E3E61C